MGIPVKLTNIVICYPSLAEPHAPPGTTNAKYGAEAIFDPTKPADSALLQELEKTFNKVLTEAGKAQFAGQIPRPFKDGNLVNQERSAKGKDPRPELENKWVLRVSRTPSIGPPPVADQNAQPMDPGAIFGGCVCNMWTDLYWSPNPTNPGVYAGLAGVQLVSDVGVTRIGASGMSFEQMFQPIAGAPAPVQQTPVQQTPVQQTPADEPPPWA